MASYPILHLSSGAISAARGRSRTSLARAPAGQAPGPEGRGRGNRAWRRARRRPSGGAVRRPWIWRMGAGRRGPPRRLGHRAGRQGAGLGERMDDREDSPTSGAMRHHRRLGAVGIRGDRHDLRQCGQMSRMWSVAGASPIQTPVTPSPAQEISAGAAAPRRNPRTAGHMPVRACLDFLSLQSSLLDWARA